MTFFVFSVALAISGVLLHPLAFLYQSSIQLYAELFDKSAFFKNKIQQREWERLKQTNTRKIVLMNFSMATDCLKARTMTHTSNLRGNTKINTPARCSRCNLLNEVRTSVFFFRHANDEARISGDALVTSYSFYIGWRSAWWRASWKGSSWRMKRRKRRREQEKNVTDKRRAQKIKVSGNTSTRPNAYSLVWK